MNAELIALAQKWKRIAATKFKHAEGEPTEAGRQFIEHGAVCYFNCATELEGMVKARDAAPDLNLQVFKKDAKSP